MLNCFIVKLLHGFIVGLFSFVVMCRGRRGCCVADVGRPAEKKSCFIERARDGAKGVISDKLQVISVFYYLQVVCRMLGSPL